MFFLVIDFSHANGIGIVHDQQHARIDSWIEMDVIEDRDLHVTLLAKLIVNEESKALNFSFTPWEDPASGNLPAKDIKFSVYQNGSSSWDYYDIFVKDGKIISAEESSVIRSPGYDYKYYYINIPLDKINFEQPIDVKIEYTIPNFIGEGIDKFVLIDTMCFPNDKCPKPTMIDKFVTLPKESVVKQFPPTSILFKRDNRLVVNLNEFTPYSPSHGQYEKKVISYTDLKNERWDKFKWLFIGIGISTIVQLVVLYLKKIYDKKIELRAILGEIKMRYSKIFEKYWDMTVTGIIGGLVVYLLVYWNQSVNNKIYLVSLIFLIAVVFVSIYSGAIFLSQQIKARRR